MMHTINTYRRARHVEHKVRGVAAHNQCPAAVCRASVFNPHTCCGTDQCLFKQASAYDRQRMSHVTLERVTDMWFLSKVVYVGPLTLTAGPVTLNTNCVALLPATSARLLLMVYSP